MNQDKTIIEIIGSSFPLEIKNNVRLGSELSKKLNLILKHLDHLYLNNLADLQLYTKIYFQSIPTIISKMKIHSSKALENYISGSFTNVRAINTEELSIQRNSYDDRDLLDILTTRDIEPFVYYFKKHIENLDKIKGVSTS